MTLLADHTLILLPISHYHQQNSFHSILAACQDLTSSHYSGFQQGIFFQLHSAQPQIELSGEFLLLVQTVQFISSTIKRLEIITEKCKKNDPLRKL